MRPKVSISLCYQIQALHICAINLPTVSSGPTAEYKTETYFFEPGPERPGIFTDTTIFHHIIITKNLTELLVSNGNDVLFLAFA
jgi:hypothetical protein